MFPWDNLLTGEGTANFMAAASSSYDWNRRAAIVRIANLGRFPKHWYTHVVDAKLPSKVARTW